MSTAASAAWWCALRSWGGSARLAWVVAASLFAAIGFLSLWPGTDLVIAGVEIWDKAAHFIAYGSLALGLAHALARCPARGAALAFAGALVGAGSYGALLEWLQGFVPGRQTSGLDALANVLGAALGASIWASLAGLARVLSRGAAEAGDDGMTRVTKP